MYTRTAHNLLMPTSKSRAFVFTFNNYTDDHCVRLRSEALTVCNYLCFGREVAPTTGTPHLQGYVRFDNPRRPASVAGLLNSLCNLADGQSFHIETARGTFDQCRDYCKKDGSFEEYGTAPKQGKRTDLRRICGQIMEGNSLKEATSEAPEAYVRYWKGLQALRSLHQPDRDFKTTVHWYWGPTGTGKTRRAYELYPAAYFKDCRTAWWDGYENQEAVILDDFRPSKDLPLPYMLRLLDRYPMQVQYKGGYVKFNSKIIIITAPLGPRELYEGLPFDIPGEDIHQLLRRIDSIVHFPADTPWSPRTVTEVAEI